MVSARGYIKASLTRIHSFVASEGFKISSISTLQTKKLRLVESFKEYERLNMEIMHLNPDDTENVGEQEDRYFSSMSRFNDAIAEMSDDYDERDIKTPSSAPQPLAQTKLPNIEINSFNGQYSEYHQFINIFTSIIHNNPSLDNVQRLYYLRNFLSNEPLDLIKNLPVTRESYPEALRILKERYDNKFLIVNDHLSRIIDIDTVNSSATSIREFVSVIKQQLAALKTVNSSVDTWDPLLICILSRKLDSCTAQAFQMDRDIKSEPTIKGFLDFLEKRALALESVEHSQGYGRQGGSGKPRLAANSSPVEGATCALCKLSHKLFSCPKFKLLPVADRISLVKEKTICSICLNSHSGKCRFHFKCNICKKGHNTLLHEDEPVAPVSLLSNNCSNQIILPTVRVKILSHDNKVLQVKALLDSGSQVSFVTNRVVKRLGLTPNQSDINIVGITNVKNKIKYSIPLEVHSLISPFKTTINCSIVDNITCQLPQNKIEAFKLPPGIKLADERYNIPGDIDMLMGCDVFFQVLLPQEPHLKQFNDDSATPCIINTRFGHVLGGLLPTRLPHSQQVSLLCTTCNSGINESMKQFWRTEEVPQIFDERAPETELCKQIFKNTVQLKDKEFQVDLPLKVPLEQVNDHLGDSFHLAHSRFLNLEKRLHSNVTLFEQYKKFINEIIELGHGHYVDIQDYDLVKDAVYFLPHHHVINEQSKTTKLRVVFDASMKTDKKISLNDILLNGPMIQRDLFEIILLFRFGDFMFATDVKRMFRCVKLNPLHTSLQNILWRENPSEEIKCIQLDTVTYGLKSSNFLATQCLNELASKYEKELPLASFIIQNCTYVDDVLYSDHDLSKITQAKTELTELLNRGGFHAHKWASNVSKILQDVPVCDQHFNEINLNDKELNFKTLGLNFDVKHDSFTISCPESYGNKPVTKREVLSYISKFYDPLGFITPIIVLAKNFIQRLWSAGIGWDSPLPDDLRHEWLLYVNSLTNMKPIALPRNICSKTAVKIQLMGFADASSSTAYGCCIYLRVLHENGKASLSLLCSKSRVKPLDKPMTVPRLELNAALLLAKLMAKVHKAISTKHNINKVGLFTDSKIVLAWTQTQVTRLKAYVANRINMVSQLTSGFTWHYVSTHDNPADLITRGVSPDELVDYSLWWNGPAFLQSCEYTFDSDFEMPSELPDTIPTAKPQQCPSSTASSSVALPVANENYDLFERFSNINKMIRVVAYILRFYNNIKTKVNSKRVKLNYLTSTELHQSLLTIIKHEQAAYFSEEMLALKASKDVTGSLKCLHPFIDNNNVMRVGGRLQNSNVSYSQKHQILLPKASRIMEMIIHSEHIRLLHAGPKLLLATLNQKFWILNGIREVKKIVHRCITCFRFKAETSKQLMGSLPSHRVVQARSFQKVGIDFAGPLSVKQSRVRRSIISKGYICIFVCFTTKAVHLELASDLTTSTFLAVFKRFVARRGLPSDVFCDNASTFKGARNQLADLYKLVGSGDHQAQVTSYASRFSINFHFIPSYSPVFGGLWEAAVKSTKFHLKRTVEKALLTYEEMSTVLAQIEAVLNSRPLIPLSSNPDDFTYLTPGHFLTGTALVSYPEHNVSDMPISRLRLWNVTTNMVQSFWNLWHKYYLNTLQCRPKWKDVKQNVKVGDLVLLKEDNAAPLTWSIARITKVFPGNDNNVRAFEVMTPNKKTHLRSITKVCLFPLP